MILDRLKATEEEMGERLISDQELRLIERIWTEDAMSDAKARAESAELLEAIR